MGKGISQNCYQGGQFSELLCLKEAIVITLFVMTNKWQANFFVCLVCNVHMYVQMAIQLIVVVKSFQQQHLNIRENLIWLKPTQCCDHQFMCSAASEKRGSVSAAALCEVMWQLQDTATEDSFTALLVLIVLQTECYHRLVYTWLFLTTLLCTILPLFLQSVSFPPPSQQLFSCLSWEAEPSCFSPFLASQAGTWRLTNIHKHTPFLSLPCPTLIWLSTVYWPHFGLDTEGQVFPLVYSAALTACSHYCERTVSLFREIL